MWRHDVDELARSDHFGFLPEFREMLRIPDYQVVSAAGIGAFEKDVVVRIAGDLEPARRLRGLRMTLDELQELLTEASADVELRAGEHLVVFRQNSVRNAEPRRFG